MIRSLKQLFMLRLLGATFATFMVTPVFAHGERSEFSNETFARLDYQIATPDAPISVSAVQVPQAWEVDFVSQAIVARRQSAKLGAVAVRDRLLILHRSGDGLGALIPNSPEAFGLAAQVITDEQINAFETFQSADHRPGRNVAGEFTAAGIKRAGIWVTIACVGSFATTFYFSAGLGPALVGTLVAAVFQYIQAARPQILWKFLNAGGKAIRPVAGAVGGEIVKNSPVTFEVGKSLAGVVWNIMTTSGYTFALHATDLFEKYQSYSELIEFIAGNAGFSFFAKNTWDLAFAKWETSGRNDIDEKTIRLMVFAKQLFLAAFIPAMYVPEFRLYAMATLAVFGAVGAVATIYGDPFISTAKRAVKGLENSRNVTSFLRAFESVREKIFGAPNSCRFLFE